MNKDEAFRRWHENEHPDLAAERAAHTFERRAIPIPASLTAQEASTAPPPWEVRVREDAADLYRDVVISGDAGVRLVSLCEGAGMGQRRYSAALQKLRASGAVSESRRLLPNSRGREQEQVVLHATAKTDA